MFGIPIPQLISWAVKICLFGGVIPVVLSFILFEDISYDTMYCRWGLGLFRNRWIAEYLANWAWIIGLVSGIIALLLFAYTLAYPV